MKKIAVIGSGAGGLITSSKLAKDLYKEIKNGEVSITIFDKRTDQEFQPGYLEVAFRGTDPSKIRRPIDKLISPGVQVVHKNIEKVDLAERYVKTEGDGGEKVDFDYIVISTGASPDNDQIDGLKEANMDFHTSANKSSLIYNQVSKIKSGRIVVGIGGVPYKCPPSPNESAFMLDEYFRKAGIRDKVEITYVTPFTRIYSAETINEVIAPMYESRNIESITVFNTDTVDSKKKEITSIEGETLKYDYLYLTPPHKTAGFLKESEIVDEDGWVKVDKKDMHITTYDNGFAIGDTTNIPISKAGVEAHLEGIVVANNITGDINGTGRAYKFTGRTQCSMETGFHKATFVVGTYDRPVEKIQPSTMNYMEKKVMEKIYWSSLHGHYEWLFKHHFKEDYFEHQEPIAH
ncbi:MAG: NAD(P)/FAD-dependent oxidoreductase [Candidatus Thermoplasmatota archaeon]|nr:NAD(P)/FAD-dependent oxidoreductase [Candidatus Thermoplasmatota archaeon]MCL5889106.1 NAD(P)/FAD-dependent oxidoreductase [Candidatus Thermoplasmatota archaeon]